ncbi:hypothetical protein [Psychroflexus maritimus]|uniref:Cell division protein ZapB n=1 Tax=Psychroflexus maritimus TaxID=2714865 RepID=A0A967DZ55_9FLAO|nr:hypothetical protein [Psychroflexus maritimus]NGZ89107.1 hypothetical protein [Psychroflexus maritimus]
MKEALQHIDLLEINLKKLFSKNKQLVSNFRLLEEELSNTKQYNKELLTQIDVLKKEIRTLKTANAILGSKENKRETKLKINSLIREIDECIVQLAD